MIFTLERVAGPYVEPVTLAEMRRHLRVYDDITTEDDDITGLISAARAWVEDYTGRALVDQTWRLTVGDYVPTDTTGLIIGQLPLSAQGIPLRRSPIIAVTSVASVDADNVETVIAASEYQLRQADSKWPHLVGLDATTTLRITYRAGFAAGLGSPDPTPDLALVPERFKQAMKLWAEAMYDRDERMMEKLLMAAEAVIRPERVNIQFA